MPSKKVSKVKNGIYKRGNRWYICYKLDGRQYRKSCGTSKQDAELALAAVKKEIGVGNTTNDWSGLLQLVAPSNKTTFAQAAEQYMFERAQHKASTVATYRDTLDGHLLPTFGSLEVRTISEAMIAKFQGDLLRLVSPKTKRNLSPRRINSIVQLLRTILKVCVRRKIIKENPCDNIDRIRQPKTNIDPLSREELEIALSNLDPFYRPLFTCLVWTGARPNELLALRWTDIDWRREEFQISKGRVRGNEGLPKTKSAERFVKMLPPVIDALKELESRKVKSALGYVFIDKSGDPINKHLDRIWARALRTAKIRHRPSYQLRHTFASLALERGASPGWVAKMLGHSTMEITFRYYARFINDNSGENERLMISMFETPSAVRCNE